MDVAAAVGRGHVVAAPLALVVALAAAACGPVAIGTPARVTPTTTTTIEPHAAEHGQEHLDGAASATERLDPARRAALGLPPVGTTWAGASLPPLSGTQWRDPEVVAARFVLVDTNHPVAEDPAQLWARRATYASARFAEDLRTSSSAAAALAELASRDAAFEGEVIGLATVSRDDSTAVVAVSVRRATTVPGHPPLRPRVAFYRLTLVPDDVGRWLVVDVEVT